MVEIINISPHSPQGMIIDVSEDEAERLIKNGSYVRRGEEEKIVEKVFKKRVVPDKSWSEKKIKAWIEKEGLDIPYSISNDSKTDVLLRLKDKGHI